MCERFLGFERPGWDCALVRHEMDEAVHIGRRDAEPQRLQRGSHLSDEIRFLKVPQP